MTALCAAIRLAAMAHDGQQDKGYQPYILHPLRVMMRCRTDDERIVAVLHDTVEDSNGAVNLDMINELFGPGIRDGVDALTRRDGETYEQFIHRCGANRLGRIVKKHDLIENMDLTRLHTVTDDDRKRREKYAAALAHLRGLDHG